MSINLTSEEDSRAGELPKKSFFQRMSGRSSGADPIPENASAEMQLQDGFDNLSRAEEGAIPTFLKGFTPAFLIFTMASGHLHIPSEQYSKFNGNFASGVYCESGYGPAPPGFVGTVPKHVDICVQMLIVECQDHRQRFPGQLEEGCGHALHVPLMAPMCRSEHHSQLQAAPVIMSFLYI